jgi:hypothetical protein
MKIIHEKDNHLIRFIPSGKFVSKLRSILRVINYRITEMEGGYVFGKIISKKKHITYIPTELKQKHNDIMIIYKFKKLRKNREDKSDDNSNNFYFRNFIWSHEYPKLKPTPENILKFSCYHIIDHMEMMIESQGDNYELAPLHSLILKFI